MGGASAAKVGLDGWTAGPLFPLSPQASSLESSCCLRWQKQGLWGLTKSHKVMPHSFGQMSPTASPDT